MMAWAAASRSIAAWTSSSAKPATAARAVSTASGPSSITLAVAVVPACWRRSRLFWAMRSASCRVEDGLPVPALMMTRRSTPGPDSADCRRFCWRCGSAAMVSADERGIGDDRRIAVLVGRGAGQVVAAVGVGTRLARLGVAVLGPHEAGVRGRVRHPGRSACLHLLAQDGHDLGAEQLDL